MSYEGMLKEGTLKDKVILVTGGGTGLGKSMSKYFLELGANVVITSRKEEALKAAKEELEEVTRGKVHYVVGDVRDVSDVNNTIESSIEKFGKIDALLNNAAGNFISPTENLSTNAFDTVVDIVLKGTYNYSLQIGKYWIENNIKGTMLNIVTTYAYTGSGYVVPSACAKGGVLTLTRSLASEWVKYGIRSNAIAPGPFPTEGAWSRLFPKIFSTFNCCVCFIISFIFLFVVSNTTLKSFLLIYEFKYLKQIWNIWFYNKSLVIFLILVIKVLKKLNF